MEKMKLSSAGVELIKKFEGCLLKAYKCPAGVWTIGYGHTKDVTPDMVITAEKAEELLRSDIRPIERTINAMGINLTQRCFDALVSWIYNLGAGNFKSSTMFRKIAADAADLDITDQLVRWINAGGKPLLGLKRRRVAEANMWLGKELYYIDESGNIKR